MSVPEPQRDSGDMQVILKAKDLCSHTLSITQNEKYFPKRYRYAITAEIQKSSMMILEELVESNEMYPENKMQAEERLMLQRKALAKCRSFLCLIQVCKDLFSLPGNKVSYLTSLVVEVRKLAIAWHKSDKKRFERYLK